MVATSELVAAQLTSSLSHIVEHTKKVYVFSLDLNTARRGFRVLSKGESFRWQAVNDGQYIHRVKSVLVQDCNKQIARVRFRRGQITFTMPKQCNEGTGVKSMDRIVVNSHDKK